MSYALAPHLAAIRRTSAPLVAICTVDQPHTVAMLVHLLNGSPLASWDVIQGVKPLNQAGNSIKQLMEGDTSNPATMLKQAPKLPERAVLIAHNLHLFLNQPGIIQGMANLRDVLKSTGALLVILAPSFKAPAELLQDVIILEEPLPDGHTLSNVIRRERENFVKDTGATVDLDAPTLERSVDALRGLGPFAAEQEVSMALSTTGLDVTRLWHRKQQVIAQTPGLSVYKGDETYASIGGLTVLKEYLTRVIHGRYGIKATLFADELEKSLAGIHGDNTGVSQDMHGTLLTYLQEREMPALLLLGPPGVGKSLTAKATGNEAGVPTVMLDLAGMKSERVGASGANLRQALKVIDAISDGKALLIGTCNDMSILPPELRRRFRLGVFFQDLPTEEEHAAIWHVYLRRYGMTHMEQLGKNALPTHTNWTGAEISQCCELAYRLNITLHEAAQYIVPIAVSASESIAQLRQEAAGRYLSASSPGPYQLPTQAPNHSARRYESL